MTFIVENGSGVVGATSYTDPSFVTAYLTDRNRLTENAWSSASPAIQQAACVKATDHIENRISQIVLGTKQFRDVRQARATLAFTAQPLANETVTIGSQAYTLVSTLTTAGDVLIGASTSATIDNLVAAILATPTGAGVTYGTGTVANPDATAEPFYDNTLLAVAVATGTAGNDVATTTTVTGGSWNFATMNGGSDLLTPQPLSFPRLSLFTRDGVQVLGIPQNLKYATAEYAVRARAAVLLPDPTADALGGIVTELSERTGPIQTTTKYLAGTVGSGALQAYPAADRLLREYVRGNGGTIRG